MVAHGYSGTPKTSSSNRTIFIGQTLLAILKKHKKQLIRNRMKYGKLYIDSNAVCTKEDGELVTPSVVKWNTRSGYRMHSPSL